MNGFDVLITALLFLNCGAMLYAIVNILKRNVSIILVGGFVIYSVTTLVPKLEKLEDALDTPDGFEPALPFSAMPVTTVSTGVTDSIVLNGIGKPIVINYWATWCKPCLAEMESFHQLYSVMKGQADFYFLSSEPLEKQREFVHEKIWHLPFFYFSSDSSTARLPADQLPTTYIINKGVVHKKKVGKADWNSAGVIDYLQSF